MMCEVYTNTKLMHTQDILVYGTYELSLKTKEYWVI
jgi:hypothetical protein